MEKMPTANNVEEPIKQKKVFKAAIVDVTELMKDQAIDVGNEKMTIEAESEELAKMKLKEKLLKGEFWSRLGQKIWKYGLKRDYNRNKEIYKASQEILKTENVFVGEGKEKEAHNKVMSDIINQFTSGYDEAIHEEAGEKKVVLGNNELEEEATGDKEAAKQLILDWATGKIDEASFKAQEERLFHRLKENQDEEKVKGNVMYTSNLFEVAEQVKLAIKNKEFMDNEDFEFEMIYGRSKAGVRTEEHFNRTERIMDKMLHSKVGQFVNETDLAIAFSCITSMARRTAVSLPGKIVPILGSALVSSQFAKKRAEMEEIKKRTLHARQMAKGENFDSKTMPNRVEMGSFNYKTESATDILKNIDQNLQILEKDGSNMSEQELNSLLTETTALEALIRLSDRRRIDLVTYSDSTKVVEERMAVDIKKRQIKNALQKIYEDGNHQIPNGQKFEEYFNSLSTTEENRLITEENTGIDAKDREFNKMKKEKGWEAAKTAFVGGAIFGSVMSEIMGHIQGHTGIVEDIAHSIKGGHSLPAGVSVEHLTMAAYLKHLIQGDAPKMDIGKIHEVLIGENHLKLPQGVNMIKNPDGTFNLMSGGKVLSEHLTTNPDGTLTNEAKNILAHNGIGTENRLIDGVTQKSVSPEEFVKNNTRGMKDILKRLHLDNDTPESNLNELKTQLGGINGTGIDANNNFVFDVGHMTTDGSFHQDISANAQELMKAGQLKMLFSMSNGTQNHVFEFTVNPDGKIIIPPGSEAGKLLFSNINGHANFLGRFGEVSQDMGNGQYRVLSTIEGKGLSNIIDTIKTHTQETILNVPGSYDGDLMFIPIVPGDPLEKLKREDKKKENDDTNKVEDINRKKDDVIDNIDRKKDDVIDNIDRKKDDNVIIEKKKTVTEISQEEYDAMQDDLKMINKAIRDSKGIITLSKDDFKSEYGKKRYMDLKSILGDRVRGFNKGENELQTIGDEIEGLLSNSKIISKEDLAKKLERESKEKTLEYDLKSDIEMINKAIRDSKGIITLDESSFKSDFGKEKYRKLKSIPEGRAKGFNRGETELQVIGNEMEKYLSNYQKIINSDKKESIEIKPEEKKGNNENYLINQYGEIIRNKKEAAKEIEKVVVKEKEFETTKKSTPETTTATKHFTAEDLSKVGTEFESNEASYKITKVSKNSGIFNIFGKAKIEVIRKNKNGEETLISYNKKDLEKELKRGGIKITKIETGK